MYAFILLYTNFTRSTFDLTGDAIRHIASFTLSDIIAYSVGISVNSALNRRACMTRNLSSVEIIWSRVIELQVFVIHLDRHVFVH